MPARKKKNESADKVEEAEATEPQAAAKGDEAVAVTGRPNDNPISEPERHFANTTFAERAKARNKRVADADSK